MVETLFIVWAVSIAFVVVSLSANFHLEKNWYQQCGGKGVPEHIKRELIAICISAPFVVVVLLFLFWLEHRAAKQDQLYNRLIT